MNKEVKEMAGLAGIRKWSRVGTVAVLSALSVILPASSAVSPRISDGEIATASQAQGVDRRWDLNKIRAQEAWGITSAGSDVLVAILDTGIDGNHPELTGKVVGNANFTSSNTVGCVP